MLFCYNQGDVWYKNTHRGNENFKRLSYKQKHTQLKSLLEVVRFTFQALKHKSQYCKQKKTLFLKVYPSKIAIKKGPAELASPNKFVIGDEKSGFINYPRKYVYLW
jgi:hypothetical protein